MSGCPTNGGRSGLPRSHPLHPDGTNKAILLELQRSVAFPKATSPPATSRQLVGSLPLQMQEHRSSKPRLVAGLWLVAAVRSADHKALARSSPSLAGLPLAASKRFSKLGGTECPWDADLLQVLQVVSGTQVCHKWPETLMVMSGCLSFPNKNLLPILYIYITNSFVFWQRDRCMHAAVAGFGPRLYWQFTPSHPKQVSAWCGHLQRPLWHGVVRC